MNGNLGDEDVDERFRRLIEEEFGGTEPPIPDLVELKPVDEPKPASLPPAPQPPPVFSLEKAIEETEPDPLDEPYVPESLPPMKLPQGTALLGLVLGGVGVVLAVLNLVGVVVPSPLHVLPLPLVAIALALLLWSIPRHRPDPPDQGAVL